MTRTDLAVLAAAYAVFLAVFLLVDQYVRARNQRDAAYNWLASDLRDDIDRGDR